jgi:hypothetical protein
MKFYLEISLHFKGRRRAHIAKDDPQSRGRCLCTASLNLEKWLLVQVLPEEVHLCKTCKHLANLPDSEAK